MENLAEDCLLVILNKVVVRRRGGAYIDDSNLQLNNLSLVSKQFLSLTRFLRNKINLTRFVQNKIDVSGKYPNVRHVFVNCKRVELDVFLGIISCGLDIHVLDIYWNRWGSPEIVRWWECNPPSTLIARWGELGQTFHNLKVFKYRHSDTLKDMDLIAIGDAMPLLEELDISSKYRRAGNGFCCRRDTYNHFVSNHGIQALSKKLSKLRKIDISGNPYLSQSSFVALSQNCVFLTQIRHVYWRHMFRPKDIDDNLWIKKKRCIISRINLQTPHIPCKSNPLFNL